MTQGRIWYIPDSARPSEFEDLRDGSLFTYPKDADTLIVSCASESFTDAYKLYPLHFMGSVCVAMGMLQMWLVAHSME
jgi:hypothetical protein